MTTAKLYAKLKKANSEEDVKDAYIKALGLKSYTKGLIDIRTDEIWFEAKDTGKHSSYAMFTQLLHYVLMPKLFQPLASSTDPNQLVFLVIPVHQAVDG
ncbi:MAG: hypothetical protein CG439_2882, partial [Methylococcaceae bacterium NSP1-2]